jgi:CheY-like chemotaxis protein
MAAHLSVLLADDNEMNRWLLSEQLQTWTDNIHCCEDGRQAWQSLLTQAFDLMLLDVNMPILDGINLIKQCRSQDNPNRATPAIAITAHAQPEMREQLLQAGFTACLIKPITLASLRQTIDECLLDACLPLDYNDYAQAILQKTEFNPRLSMTLLEKLFAELPVQLNAVAEALHSDIQNAKHIVHKLHGSFCFYGFEDIRPLVAELEQQLLDQQHEQAKSQFERLNARCTYLLAHQTQILQQISNAVAS